MPPRCQATRVWQSGHIHAVLDGDWQSMKLAQQLTCGSQSVEVTGAFYRSFRVNGDERVEISVIRFDANERIMNHLIRRHLLGRNRARKFDRT
jgi:hypothetical protein